MALTPRTLVTRPAWAGPMWWMRRKYGTAQKLRPASSSWETVSEKMPSHMVRMWRNSRAT